MIRPGLCCGSNLAGLPDTAGLVLWELGKDFGCLEQLHHLSPGLRSYLKGGQWLPAADGKAAAGRCREWQPSSRWKSLRKEFCTVQAIVVGHSQMRKANNILACIKPHSFLPTCLHCLFVE